MWYPESMAMVETKRYKDWTASNSPCHMLVLCIPLKTAVLACEIKDDDTSSLCYLLKITEHKNNFDRKLDAGGNLERRQNSRRKRPPIKLNQELTHDSSGCDLKEGVCSHINPFMTSKGAFTTKFN